MGRNDKKIYYDHKSHIVNIGISRSSICSYFDDLLLDHMSKCRSLKRDAVAQKSFQVLFYFEESGASGCYYF